MILGKAAMMVQETVVKWLAKGDYNQSSDLFNTFNIKLIIHKGSVALSIT